VGKLKLLSKVLVKKTNLRDGYLTQRIARDNSRKELICRYFIWSNLSISVWSYYSYFQEV